MSVMSPDEQLNGVAIIGMDGRFPGARNLEEFWMNLRDGVHSISFFKGDEIEPGLLNSDDEHGPRYVRAGGVLDDVEFFDAPFFNFTPREAELTDPQHRLFLECAWSALEAAGYDPESCAGRIGVFAGSGASRYLFHILSNRQRLALGNEFQVLIGNEADHLATKVSYKLNLRGPSINCQTTCSTSLVAVCLACQSLLDFHCDMALAGGVSISFPQREGYIYEENGIGSPDGYCRAFDAAARGTVAGNGLGVVVLKRLSDALRDGDSIHAVIRGFAINNDGSDKIGYTAPSVEGQAEVIAEALAVARVAPETISYIEAHGTGTPLGDPIEIAALTRAFGAAGGRKGFCAIGSVKTNIGHLNTAAGVAGLIKTVLALKNKALPANLHFTQPNPQIDFAGSPFRVNDRLTEWAADDKPRRAGVSSFGIGGTNAHVILEEAPRQPSTPASRPAQLLVLSARTESALESATANLSRFLKSHDEVNFADVAYTLQVGRRAFKHRRALVCRDAAEAAAALDAHNTQRVSTGLAQGLDRSVVMMFSGEGSQYVGMGGELYSGEPIFREQVNRCSEMLSPRLGYDLRDVLYAEAEPRRPWSSAQSLPDLNQASVAQTALFVVEYALARLWMEWGVRPEAMIGHGVGEYVAACLSGVMSLEDALALVAARGLLMQQLPAGRMLALATTEEEARRLVEQDERLSLAAVNTPRLCVVSGPSAAIERLAAQCEARRIECHDLGASHAFQSRMKETLLDDFAAKVRAVDLKSPQIPFISSVTGKWITSAQATAPDYWAQHPGQTVRFAEGLSVLDEEPGRVWLEVGPGDALCSAVRQTTRDADAPVLPSLRRAHQHASDGALLLDALGKLWVAGKKVAWHRLYADESRRRIALPTYPFERRPYWVGFNREAFADASHAAAPHASGNGSSALRAPERKPSPTRAASDEGVADEKFCCLIIGDENGAPSPVGAELEAQGHNILAFRSSREFQRIVEQVFQISPGTRLNLLEELRRAVSEQQQQQQQQSHPDDPACGAASADQTEQTITEIWRELFGIEQIGLHDNFFELGGNSLLGLQLMSRMRKVFMTQIPMEALFESPTIAGLAAVVSELQMKEKGLEELEQLLAEIEGLSEEELETKLNRRA